MGVNRDSCVLLLVVSSYSSSGLHPAPVMLKGGGVELPVLHSHTNRTFEESGWGFQKQAGKYVGNKPCWECGEVIWHETRVWLSRESDFITLIYSLQAQFLPFKGVFWW